MTLQEVFNKAYAGLRNQGFEKSQSESAETCGPNKCLYRGPNGLKCAIGHAIPDSLYHGGMEGKSPIQDIISNLFPGININDLETLQNCHDSADSPDDMKERLICFAGKFELIVPK